MHQHSILSAQNAVQQIKFPEVGAGLRNDAPNMLKSRNSPTSIYTIEANEMYVNYKVTMGEFVHSMQAGPFTKADADEQARDIKIYEGVSEVYVSPHRDVSRQLISNE